MDDADLRLDGNAAAGILSEVFAALFSPDGSGIHLKPAPHYVQAATSTTFATVIEAARRRGETAIGYYIGFDRAINATVPIYFRLLQTVVDDALKLGCKKLSLGRTALEPKARLGARPDPLRIWIRHRIPMLNVLVRALLHTISHHDEPPARNPFKAER